MRLPESWGLSAVGPGYPLLLPFGEKEGGGLPARFNLYWLPQCALAENQSCTIFQSAHGALFFGELLVQVHKDFLALLYLKTSACMHKQLPFWKCLIRFVKPKVELFLADLGLSQYDPEPPSS